MSPRAEPIGDAQAMIAFQRAADAYALMASGRCGKVAVVFDEEVR